MKRKYNIRPELLKILEGMDKVNDNLISFKKRMNSDLVVFRDGKIQHIKP